VSIRFGLLSLLSEQPKYGYQLRSEFESATAGTWPLNIGQVYSTLQRLERDKLVEATESETGGDGERRLYRLTEQGRDHLGSWFSQPVPLHAATRSELVVKVIMAASVPSVDARTVIDVQRAASMEALQAHTRAKVAAAGDLTASLAADAVIFNVEAEIRWLEHCESRLGKTRRGQRR
jgi:DNA-binding PadR family transcriptional regulator